MVEEEPEDVEKLLWVEDPDHAWLLAEKTEDDGAGTVTCVIRPPFSGSKTFMMTDKNCCGVDPSHIDPAQFDIAQMNNMSEAPLIAMLRRRLYTGRIYTLVSDVLIAVNPYCYIKNDVYPDGINTRDNVPDRYMKGSEPHVFQTADNAFRQMSDQGNKVRDQSAIVSGESGAGKTVACKCVMEYLAILTGLEKKARGIEEPVGDDAPKSMEDLILNCNPFLEAFGNAKTNMNDNSSRFGKFIKMLYNSSMICGGAMEQYLLEKARLVFQGPGERNYHVFYFLAKGMTPEEKTTLGLKEPEEVIYVLTDYSYLLTSYLLESLLPYLL
jgi:myosin heavy subunit